MAPVLLEFSAVVLRRDVRLRLADFADFDAVERLVRFAPDALRDAALVPVFALLLALDPVLRDLVRDELAFLRAELAFERLAEARELFAPRRAAAAAFFLPPVARDFALRLLLPLREVVLRVERARADLRLPPPSSIIPAPADADPACSLSSSIPDPLLRAMAPAS